MLIPILGYETLYGLQFNDDGQPEIISIAKRKHGSGWLKPGRVLKQSINSYGYKTIGLTDLSGNQKGRFIHRCVWECLHGEIPENMTINHIDCNKLNNKPENLELVTREKNTSLAWKLGLHNPLKGDQHPSAKKVIDIISGKVFGTIKEAGESIGMNKSTIKAQLSGRLKNKTNFRYYGDL